MSHLTFVKYFAPKLLTDDPVFYWDRSLDWRRNHNEIPLELFKSICCWKSSRPFRFVCKDKKKVNKQWQDALEKLHNGIKDGAIKEALYRLDALPGVGIPTASALLTAWNPEEFCIVDFKTLAVLGMKNGNVTAKKYIEFRKRIIELRGEYKELRRCSLRQVELALWSYYPIWKSR